MSWNQIRKLGLAYGPTSLATAGLKLYPESTTKYDSWLGAWVAGGTLREVREEGERKKIHSFQQIPIGVYFQNKLGFTELEVCNPSKEMTWRIWAPDTNLEALWNWDGIIPSSKRTQFSVFERQTGRRFSTEKCKEIIVFERSDKLICMDLVKYTFLSFSN